LNIRKWIELRWRLRQAATDAERAKVRRSVGAKYAKRAVRKPEKETTA